MTQQTATPLIVDHEESGRTYYKAVQATVNALSTYNDTEFSLSGLPGFWQLIPELRPSFPDAKRPAVGTSGTWLLYTKPKTGANAKPGARYQNVSAYQSGAAAPAPARQTPEQVAEQVAQARKATSAAPEPQGDPREGYVEQQAARQEQKAATGPRYDDRDASIVQQVAFKAATEILVAHGQGAEIFPAARIEVIKSDWVRMFDAFVEGRHPAPADEDGGAW